MAEKGKRFILYHGDCRAVMAKMREESVDSIVCDPPYGLKFMGKEWDHGVPGVPFWEAVLRVAKPGAYLLAFGGTRTFHRLAVAIEDAGWEIRDTVMWIYGSGFPKSHNVSKGIDKAAGAKRKDLGPNPNKIGHTQDMRGGNFMTQKIVDDMGDHARITAPATDEAKQWDGWGTALKPAWEPIIVARKPFKGTVAANVLEHGTGALNIDACRVEYQGEGDKYSVPEHDFKVNQGSMMTKHNHDKKTYRSGNQAESNQKGRFPANLIHDGSEEVVGFFPVTKGKGHFPKNTGGIGTDTGIYGKGKGRDQEEKWMDGGSAARFFYCSKASKKDRGEGNNHPTIKPTDLMRYLVRLVTQPNGVVLDPFAGSASTGKAALLEGMKFIGIEKKAEYIEIGKHRLQEIEREADSR